MIDKEAALKLKARAKKTCKACSGHGILNYQCRPSGCWDSGVEVGPCCKCLKKDWLAWKKADPWRFEPLGD